MFVFHLNFCGWQLVGVGVGVWSGLGSKGITRLKFTGKKIHSLVIASSWLTSRQSKEGR